MSLSRRTVIAAASAAAGLALVPRRARAIGPGSKFRFGQLQLGPAWDVRPTGLRRMAWEVDKQTSIDVDLEPVPVSLRSEKLHELPFLVLTGDREIAMPPVAEVEALRRFLTFGGFLLIDSADGTTDGAFDQSVRKLIDEVFPRPATGLEIIPTDHVIYRSFYLLDKPVGRVAVSPALEGVTRDGRVVCVYAQNDLAGAWSRDNFGNWEFSCEPDGEKQRDLAFRFGINLVMYALCLDYKTDQVHVPFIMRRRRWKPDDGATPAPAKPAPKSGGKAPSK
jgi:hypothetical protein